MGFEVSGLGAGINPAEALNSAVRNSGDLGYFIDPSQLEGMQQESRQMTVSSAFQPEGMYHMFTGAAPWIVGAFGAVGLARLHAAYLRGGTAREALPHGLFRWLGSGTGRALKFLGTRIALPILGGSMVADGVPKGNVGESALGGGLFTGGLAGSLKAGVPGALIAGGVAMAKKGGDMAAKDGSNLGVGMAGAGGAMAGVGAAVASGMLFGAGGGPVGMAIGAVAGLGIGLWHGFSKKSEGITARQTAFENLSKQYDQKLANFKNDTSPVAIGPFGMKLADVAQLRPDPRKQKGFNDLPVEKKIAAMQGAMNELNMTLAVRDKMKSAFKMSPAVSAKLEQWCRPLMSFMLSSSPLSAFSRSQNYEEALGAA